MTESLHRLIFADSRDLSLIPDDSVDLVVTSPPYPMIEMWDQAFGELNPEIAAALRGRDGVSAFELMHQELDKVWKNLQRILRDGAWVCINIGDATRTVGKRFQLYSNHTRITHAFRTLGLPSLPMILWRKKTNAPNKFMGSGMLPAGAYVTLEHEYILIFRKGDKRSFKTSAAAIKNRQESALFWEERNVWFSDIWDVKGIRQPLHHARLRERSAAFPFELVYRLINMYSVRGDWVLDPFLGTGTTLFAAMAACRNSIGIEIDPNFGALIRREAESVPRLANSIISKRLNDHIAFMTEYEIRKGKPKHRNTPYGFAVVTSQETNLLLNYLTSVTLDPNGEYRVSYEEPPHIRDETPRRQNA